MPILLGPEAIHALLPQRATALMLDRAELAGDQARGLKLLSVNEAFFSGHFPGQPIMPGVLQVEAMVQLAQVLLQHSGEAGGQLLWLSETSRIKFRRPVLPGDVLKVSLKREPASAPGQWQFSGRTDSAEGVTCEANFTLKSQPLPLPELPIEPPPGRPLPEAPSHLFSLAALPHRYPFLWVDRVLHSQELPNGDGEVMGLKNITANESYFIPGTPGPLLVPNLYLLEMAAQMACAYTLASPANLGKLAYFMAIDTARFNHFTRPGDQLQIAMHITLVRGRFGRSTGKIFVGQELAAELELKFAIAEQGKDGGA